MRWRALNISCAVAATAATLLAPVAFGVSLEPNAGELTFESTVAKSVETREGPVAYNAVVSRFELPDGADGNDASFYVYSYVRSDVPSESERPIAFIFNGGPGSSSVWLHMGFAAPVRIPERFAAPGVNETVRELDANPDTLLAAADLVFIDPIGTGFSRATGSDRDYWGVAPDAESVAALVRAYLRQHNRLDAPVFLVGESYGGVRAAAMLGPLLEQSPRVNVQGVVLISPALETGTIVDRNSDQSLVGRLPSYAALAWYHGMIDNESVDLWSHIALATEMADGLYARAVASPDDLSGAEVETLIDTLESLTGVDRDTIREDRLRVTGSEFLAAAQRVTGGMIGNLDARFVASRGAPTEIPAETFGSAMRLHLRNTWRIDTEGRYTLMNYRANGRWRGPDGRRHFFRGDIDTLGMIEQAQAVKPDLAVLVVSGVYDLVTPFGAARDALTRSGLDRDRLRVFEYPSGHMIYLEEDSHRALSADIRAFFREYSVAPAAP
jgi:carboxypeptidase C (cathepsin A)